MTTTLVQPVDTTTEALVQMANDLVSNATTKPTFKEKLKSRKFWIAAAGCVAGICGMIGFNDNIIAIISFAVLEVVSILGYCISEGVIDANRSKQLNEALQTLIGMINTAQNGGIVEMPSLSEADRAEIEANLDALSDENLLPDVSPDDIDDMDDGEVTGEPEG